MIQLSSISPAPLGLPRGKESKSASPEGVSKLKSIINKRRSTIQLRQNLAKKPDAEVPLQEAEIKAHKGGSADCITYSACGRLLASGGEDKTISIMSALNLKLMDKGLEDWVCESSVESLSFSPDGKILASGHKKGQGK